MGRRPPVGARRSPDMCVMHIYAVGMESRPIGYWVKLLDDLLERHLDEVLSSVALDRRRWQLLNVLADGSRSLDDVLGALSPFLDRSALDAHLDGLVAAGLVDVGASTCALTQAGRDLRAIALARVTDARREVSHGVSADDYATTVGTLRTMCGILAGGAQS